MQKDDAQAQNSQLRDISAFLAPTGLAEVKFIRRLSTMCAQTYLMSKLTVRPQLLQACTAAIGPNSPTVSSHVQPLQEKTLHRRLGLRLVTSSTAVLSHKPAKRSLQEIVEYADAMGVTRLDAEQAQIDALCTEESPAMKVSTQFLLAAFSCVGSAPSDPAVRAGVHAEPAGQAKALAHGRSGGQPAVGLRGSSSRSSLAGCTPGVLGLGCSARAACAGHDQPTAGRCCCWADHGCCHNGHGAPSALLS